MRPLSDRVTGVAANTDLTPLLAPITDLTPSGKIRERVLQFVIADARRRRHDARNAGIIRQIWEPDGMPPYGPRKGLRAS